MCEDNVLLSFVIPCYRSEHTIKKVINEIIETVAVRPGYDYEIIAVNDCSPDRVLDVLRSEARSNNKIKIVNLVKNMGKHTAVLAGYSFVKGSYVINLDDDFQSPVNEMWKLLDPVMRDECDVAMAEYENRKETLWKRLGSNINLTVSQIMLDKPKGLRYESLYVMKRFVTDEMTRYSNPYPFIEGLILRVTSRIITVPVEQRERADDNSTGYTFRKSLSLFANGFTNFSVKPLRLALIIGILFAFLGLIFGIYIICRKLTGNVAVLGWSSLMAVQLFAGGIIMMLLGIIGEYVGRIFICINGFPQYVIRETVNIEKL